MVRARERRYFNVFFAYRGTPISDAELSDANQLEDNVTRALAVTLEHLGAESMAEFLHKICGISNPSTSRVQLEQQAVGEPLVPAVTRVVGISPLGDLAERAFEESAAGSRPDLLLEQPGESLVLIESKVVGGVDAAQMDRHARAFGLPRADFEFDPPRIPAEWRQRSWEDVANWASTAVEADPVGAYLLEELTDYLELAGLRAGAPVPRRKAVVVPPLDREAEARVGALIAACDLSAVEAAARELYGDPRSKYYVYGDNEEGHTYTTADSAAVRASCVEAGEPVPPKLLVAGGNVITARRGLCIVYGPKSRYVQSIATDKTRDAAGALLGVGADRVVLLALLAWALGQSTTRAQRMMAIVSRAWPNAPLHGMAAPELSESLGARVAAAVQVP